MKTSYLVNAVIEIVKEQTLTYMISSNNKSKNNRKNHGGKWSNLQIKNHINNAKCANNNLIQKNLNFAYNVDSSKSNLFMHYVLIATKSILYHHWTNVLFALRKKSDGY